MARAKKNVHHLEEGHLVRARQHAAEAESLGRKSIEAWARCADEIIAAKEAASADGRKLTDANTGKALGWPVLRDKNRPNTWHCSRVSTLVSWRRKYPVVDAGTPGPFGREQSDSSMRSHARVVLRKQPDVIIAEALKHPDIACRIIRDLQAGLASAEPDEPEPAPRRATESVDASSAPTMSSDDIEAASKASWAEYEAEMQAEEAAEEAERQQHVAAEKARDDDPPYDQVVTAIGRLNIHGGMLTLALRRLTPNRLQQLSDEDRETLLPQLIEALSEVQVPVENAMAACLAVTSTSKSGVK